MACLLHPCSMKRGGKMLALVSFVFLFHAPIVQPQVVLKGVYNVFTTYFGVFHAISVQLESG